MSVIPENTVTDADIALWWETQQQLSKLKATEALLRNKIFKHWFPAPVEGTNSLPLPDGFVAKGVYKINRDVDEAALKLYTSSQVVEGVPAGPSVFEAHQISVDALIRYKPELNIRAYRALTDEQRKIFDQALTIKVGMPDLKISPPSSRNQDV